MKKLALAAAILATSTSAMSVEMIQDHTYERQEHMLNLDCNVYSPNVNAKASSTNTKKELVGRMHLTYNLNDKGAYLTNLEAGYKVALRQKDGSIKVTELYIAHGLKDLGTWGDRTGNLVEKFSKWGGNSVHFHATDNPNGTGIALQITGFQRLHSNELSWLGGSIGLWNNKQTLTVVSNHYFECGDMTSNANTVEYKNLEAKMLNRITAIKADMNTKMELMRVESEKNALLLKAKTTTLEQAIETINNMQDDKAWAINKIKELNVIIANYEAEMKLSNERQTNLQLALDTLSTQQLESSVDVDTLKANYAETLSWYASRVGELKNEINNLKAKNDKLSADLNLAIMNQLNVDSDEVAAPTANEVNTTAAAKGGSGSMGLGLALLGLFGAARRFKK